MTWSDCLGYTPAWDTLIWFSGGEGGGEGCRGEWEGREAGWRGGE